MKISRTLGMLAGLAMMGSCALTLSAAQTVEKLYTNLFEPYGVAVERSGDGPTYITDGGSHRIIKYVVGTSNPASIFAGETGVAGTNDGPAAHFNQPQGIVLARGGVVVADSANHTLRLIDANGIVSTLAGTAGSWGLSNGPALEARFRYPAGLAVDSANGDIYIADSQNNAIRKLDTNNMVTTLLTANLYQPGGIALGANGDLWIADTRHHCIKRLETNGTVTVVAGTYNVSGTQDSTTATNASFTLPRALIWRNGEVLVSDSGNHAIRRIYYNPIYGTYSVTTFAGTPGTFGNTDGTPLAAQFNTPVGIAEDTLAGGFLIADKGNNALRFINLGTAQPPVVMPIIGTVHIEFDSNGNATTKLDPATNAVTVLYNTNFPIAILGENGSIYYTLDGSIPDPQGTNASTLQYTVNYQDHQDRLPRSVCDPKTNFTLTALGFIPGRRSSQTNSAAFKYQVASPLINGDNAATFAASTITENADLYYTIDGSEPSEGSTHVQSDGRVKLTLDGFDMIFKVKGFRKDFTPSITVSKTFRWTDFLPNEITLGFTNGEASSEFVAGAGQRFFVPITLGLLNAQKIFSLQCDLFVTNAANNLPVDMSAVGFQSLLMKRTDSKDSHSKAADGIVHGIIRADDPEGRYMIPILPAMVLSESNFTYGLSITNGSLLVTNPSINLLSFGWLERSPYTNLYDTRVQDLVTYSQPHDRTFYSSGGKAVLGAFSFVVPTNSNEGDAYTVWLDRVSATEDGVSKDVYIRIPRNGSVGTGAANGTKRVTVGSRRYIVGDVAPFRWYNAGDFGDGRLVNNDVLQVYEAAIYNVNLPPEGSDLLDALDASDGSINPYLWTDGSNYEIDDRKSGDGQLAIDDVYVIYRRSLDPTLKWYARYWSNNVRQVVEVPNTYTITNNPSAAPAVAAPAMAQAPGVSTATPFVSVTVDDVVGTPGTSVQVPIRVHVNGARPLKMAMFKVTVEPLDGSPDLVTGIALGSSPLGAPTFSSSLDLYTAGVAWLGSSASITGDVVLAPVTVPIPPSAGPGSAYRLRIENFSATPNGISLFRSSTYSGLVTTAARSASTLGDSIPDSWRLRWFGSAYSPLSSASADPDNDGRDNYTEYLAGTDPLTATGSGRLALSTAALNGGVKVTFPTGIGRTYILEGASELLGPWSPLSTNAGTGGWRDWTDTPAGGVHFYRVRAQ